MMKNQIKNDIHGGNLNATLKRLGLKKAPDLKSDFSVNINPAGPPLNVARTLISVNEKLYSDYPEIYAETALRSLAKAHNLSSESVIIGNGSTELFSMTINSKGVAAFKPGKNLLAVHCRRKTGGQYVDVGIYSEPSGSR